MLHSTATGLLSLIAQLKACIQIVAETRLQSYDFVYRHDKPLLKHEGSKSVSLYDVIIHSRSK